MINWAVDEDADMWLKPLTEVGLTSISIGSGDFHSDYRGEEVKEEKFKFSLERTADSLSEDMPKRLQADFTDI